MEIVRSCAGIAIFYLSLVTNQYQKIESHAIIELRPFAALPAVNHRSIKSHFHFVPEGSGPGKASSMGPLIAWNDDELAPISGFPEHPHRDVDIVT
jgi:hypothetical protein